MKKTLSLCCLLIVPALAHAIDITIGGTKLSIPAPAGFAPVTSEMKPYSDLARRFVPPSNEQFALFLPSAEVALAAQGQIPQTDRRFYVQTTKELVQPFVSAGDFAELKKAIRTQNDELIKKAQAEMPGLLDQMNKGVAADFKVDLGLSKMQMLPLPPHYETDRALAYAMIVKFNVNDESGKPSVSEGVVTATFVYVQGKVIFLYANAEKTALEWSRTESRKWADAVIAANPSSAEVAAREAGPAAGGFDWGELGTRALIGAVIGGAIGLVGMLIKKFKR